MVDRVGHWHLDHKEHHFLVGHLKDELLLYTIGKHLNGLILAVLDGDRGAALFDLERT